MKDEKIGYIDEVYYNNEKWQIYEFKDNENKFGYVHDSITCCGLNQQFRIHISFENGMYKFDSEEYTELCGSGGWHRWVSWEGGLRDILLKDAKERIKS